MSESAIVQADDYRGLQMAVSVNDAKLKIQQLQAFVKTVMVKGEDYGRIPGTPKDCLFQPGAQKLCELYGLGWRFEDVTVQEDWTTPFFFYRRRCVIFGRRDRQDIGDGFGSCNSKEDRYAWRWIFASDIPEGVKKEDLVRRQKQGRNGKYYVYRLPNPDVFSLVNTIDKMASKRAYVGAVIASTRSSGLFTQDLEDLPAEAYEAVDVAPVIVPLDPEEVGEQIKNAETLDDMAKVREVMRKARNEKTLSPEDWNRLVGEAKLRGEAIERELSEAAEAEEALAQQEQDAPPEDEYEREPGVEG